MSDYLSEISEQDFDGQVLNEKEVPVLVDFFAVWCGPCKTQTPILENAAKNLNGKLKIFKVDVDKSPQIAAKYGIQAVPTLLLFHRGEPLERWMGVTHESAIKQKVEGLTD